MTEERPNCYDCKHRGTVPGSCHSSCHHPETKAAHDDTLAVVSSIFASVGRSMPQIAVGAAVALDITAKEHGVKNGWFNWPWDFDPVWLTTCVGFEQK